MRITKSLLAAASAAAIAASAFAFDDEPDELNWDSLGGTLTGFRHLRGTCAAEAIRESVRRWRESKISSK